MPQSPTTTIRIPKKLKEEANAIFKELGITMSTAVNAFLATVARSGGIPFDLVLNETGHGRGGVSEQSRNPKNVTLNQAFRARRDEFYTQYEDIEKEIRHYPNKFRGKHVLCNCDDPFESEFFRYFVLNFDDLGLARLTSTCFATSPFAGMDYPLDAEHKRPYLAVVTEVPSGDITMPDGSLDLESIFALDGNSIQLLRGDGDFRSQECVSLLEESDIVVTNPPFSLFREYISQLVDHGKDFLVLGNMNAATYREVFPLFRENKLWYGESIRSGDRKFYVPESYPLNASNCGVDESGRRYIRVKGVRWFTNLDNARRHEELKLKSFFTDSRYPMYENYSAIEVGRTIDIPSDYNELMGVPITFLDKYNPDQFEIIMLANGNARTNVDQRTLEAVGYCPHPEDRGGVGIVGGQRCYARILIRKRAS
ncbi:type II toxin-antitoxin system RelB/DinJ family antitoxin [Micrococcus lylae]|uniref:type II toxin-antitoxin system RelB/DinJ family antitoxin n=1 Tax=Micrococcus lylae TaxID=1273 RepID=UPI000B3540DA|nr:type II toxin-antitoxin system RelB/DinJ family antitoxin [Micrococcus lylae]